MKLACQILGHKLPDKAVPVYSSSGKWNDEFGNCICYRAFICERCGKREPASAEDAVEKAKKTAEISAVMNGERARYGLGPISWED